MDVISILGLLVGVAGLAYGLHQGHQMKLARHLMLDHSLKMFRTSFAICGFIQQTKVTASEVNPTEVLSRADSLSEELANDIIFHASYFTDITESRLRRWITTGKVPPNSEAIIRNFLSDNERVANNRLNPISGSRIRLSEKD